MTSPSETIFAADASAENGKGQITIWIGSAYPYMRHDTGCNILRADGHASWMRLVELGSSAAPWWTLVKN